MLPSPTRRRPRRPPRRSGAVALLSLLALLLSACGASGGAGDLANEPPLETPLAKLDAALVCTPFTHPDRPPVLLVHGTLTAGYEQWEWTYLPLLVERGFDVCYVTYPDRGLNDLQVSAEYVVHALRRIRAESGRKVAMIGHSQGGLMPRWALKWWPSAREAVEDFVLLASPNHGTVIADLNPFSLLPLDGLPTLPLVGAPPALFQFRATSNFVRALNLGDETPGEIDYTNLYTLFDELVQPALPTPTAALDLGQNNPRVTNLLLQDLCPGRLVDHLTIGLTDRLTFELVLDAIENPGPADPDRAGGSALCGLLPIVPDQIVSPAAATAVIRILQQSAAAGLPNLQFVTAEPPLKPYAQTALSGSSD